MPNLSDFFPAQAATGTGLPVNTHESFYVGGTGNPSGYNATTGLYTHPNGDVWLKTGYTIIDNTNSYAAAAYSSKSLVGTGVLGPAVSNTYGKTYDYTNNVFYLVSLFSPVIVTRYDFSGTADGWTYNATTNLGLTQGRGLSVDATNGILYISGTDGNSLTAGVNIATQTATGFSFRFPSYNSMTTEYDPYTGNFWSVQAQTYADWGLFNSSGVKIAGTYLPGTDWSNITVDADYFYVAFPTSTMRIYDKTTYGLLETISFSPTQSKTRSISYNPNSKKMWIGGNSNFDEYAMSITIGDATARTDASTGQPLFVKLK